MVLGRDLPEWLEQASSVMPENAEFFTEMGQRVDPAEYDLLVGNLGLRLGESEVRRAFEAYLWEMGPCLPRPVAP